MNYFEAPNYYSSSDSPKLFLAGGITGCPDWQSEATRMIRELSMGLEIIIFNPRRADFDVEDRRAEEQQITWEFHHLRAANTILFWFPPQTIQPIALYELGAWSATHKPLAVGCHPQYPRRADVVIQTRLARPEVVVMPTLEQTVGQALVGLARFVPGITI